MNFPTRSGQLQIKKELLFWQKPIKLLKKFEERAMLLLQQSMQNHSPEIQNFMSSLEA
jgi:hypothetical protein